MEVTPASRFMSPKDSEPGSVKISGLSAAWTFTSPAPSSSTDASCVRALFPQAAPAVDISADFICRTDQSGCRWVRSATAPVTCGADMLVPSKLAKGEPPVNWRRVADRISPPGAATSGFSWWPKALGPPAEKLVITPLRPVSISVTPGPIRIGARPPRVPRYARRLAPSRSEIIPERTGRTSGIGFASPKRLSTMTRPAAPAAAARTAFEKNVQRPRVISAKEPAREPRGRGFVPAFGSRPIPQSWVGTGCPFVPVIAVTSTSERSDWPHAEGAPSASGLKGMRRTDAGAVGTLTASAGAKT